MTGSALNRNMSLIQLLENDAFTDGDYLTLLVHLGVVAVTEDEIGAAEFRSTSQVYRTRHLQSLNVALASSISHLLELKTKNEMYGSREAILENFLKALSVTRMSLLVAWVKNAPQKNRILELQLQGSIVSQLRETFTAATQTTMSQEDKLKSGRSDVTISTASSTVVLELKQSCAKPSPPIPSEWTDYHNQLRGYVEDRRMQTPDRGGRGFCARHIQQRERLRGTQASK